MKKVLAVLLAVTGFSGMAMFAIFFAETHTDMPFPSFGVPRTGLTADIAASDPLADNAAAPGSSTSQEQNQIPTIASGTGNFTISAATSSNAIPTPEPQKDTTSATVPAVSTASPNAIPEEASPSLPAAAIATATVTVTPTAPALPPPMNGTTAVIPTPDGITLPYAESDFQNDAHWRKIWGSLTTGWSGFLDLSAGPDSTGGAAYLDTSLNLSNMLFKTNVNWIAGKMIGLMADYDDASDYLLCEYDNHDDGTVSVRLAHYVHGNELFLTPATAIPWNGSEVELAMETDGIYASCSLGAQTISNQAIGPGTMPMSSPGSGGVGFMVNDATPDTAEMTIASVSIQNQ